MRTILDMSGQHCKFITSDENVILKNSAMNEKCASGTGCYLERIVNLLVLPLKDL